MWYVIQVESGQEENMTDPIRKALDGVIRFGLFVPKYAAMRKRGGNQDTVIRPLFAGYLFLDVDGVMNQKQNRTVEERLWMFVSRKAEPVCIGGGFYPIREDEQQFLAGMMNPRHEIEKSVGDIVEGKLVIRSGPLKGKTHLVTKIDRHKQVGIIRASLWGRERAMKVGLEVVSKT